MRVLASCAAIAMLAACSGGEEGGDVSEDAVEAGESAPTSGEETETAETPSSFEEAFTANFRSEFVAGCESEFAARGADQALTERICGCVADTVARDRSPMELAGVTEDDVAVAAAECQESMEQPDG